MYSIVIPVSQTDPIVYDLATVEDVEAELKITSNTANDTEVAEQIAAASKALASICDRVFAKQTVTETFHIHIGDCVLALPLSRWPVSELISIKQNDADVAANQYDLNPNDGLIYKPHWRSSFRGHWWGKIEVEYTGGYDLPEEAPSALSMACKTLIKDRRFASRDPNIQDVWVGDNRVRYFQNTREGLPPGIADLISPFKRLAV